MNGSRLALKYVHSIAPTNFFAGISFLVVLTVGLEILISSPKAEEFVNQCFEGTGQGVRIAEIEDGRTIRLSDGRRIRLAGIIPIVSHGQRAIQGQMSVLDWLNAMDLNSDLSLLLLSDNVDRYGRLPALVAIDGRSVQEGLLSAGLAVLYPEDRMPATCHARFLSAEREGRSEDAGAWGTGEIALLPASDYDQISEWTGRFAIVEGTVGSVGTRKNRTYLNFGTYWSQDMTVEINASYRENFGGADALEYLTWRTIRVRGFIESKGGPMMEVRSPRAVEIVGGSWPTGPVGHSPGFDAEDGMEAD